MGEPHSAEEWTSARARTLAWLACLAPALALLRPLALAWITGEDAPAASVASALCGLVWLGHVAHPRWRPTWCSIAAQLAEKAGVARLALCSLLALVAAHSLGSGELALGLFGGCVLLTSAAVWELGARDRARLQRLLILGAIQLGLLVALDWGVRVFVLPQRSHNSLFVEHDARLGWRLRRGLSMEREEEQYRSRETTNSLGLRSPELAFEKPTDATRVLLLGDSHVEGYTVNDDETLRAELERIWKPLGRVEVVALGVGGWSTDQELLAYLELGRRWEPRVVLLVFAPNDVPFNVLDRYYRGRKPRFERHGDRLILTGVPVPDLRDSGLVPSSWISVSAIAALAETWLRQLAIRRAVEVEADPQEAWRVTELLLRDLRDVVGADGARLFVTLPDPRADAAVTERLIEVLASLGVPYLPLDDIYVDEFASYWSGTHWNGKGQRAVALHLAGELGPFLAR